MVKKYKLLTIFLANIFAINNIAAVLPKQNDMMQPIYIKKIQENIQINAYKNILQNCIEETDKYYIKQNQEKINQEEIEINLLELLKIRRIKKKDIQENEIKRLKELLLAHLLKKKIIFVNMKNEIKPSLEMQAKKINLSNKSSVLEIHPTTAKPENIWRKLIKSNNLKIIMASLTGIAIVCVCFFYKK